MPVVLQPLGVQCNIQCQYCYQNTQRDAIHPPHTYDLEKMKTGVEKEGGPFIIFGGEALLLPENDLEELWAWGLQKYGSNGIQTNGTLINDNHIRLFKQYKVGLGIPCQGIAFGFLKWEKGRSSLPTGETHDQTDVYGRRH